MATPPTLTSPRSAGTASAAVSQVVVVAAGSGVECTAKANQGARSVGAAGSSIQAFEARSGPVDDVARQGDQQVTVVTRRCAVAPAVATDDAALQDDELAALEQRADRFHQAAALGRPVP